MATADHPDFRAVIAALPDVVHVYDVETGILSRVVNDSGAPHGFGAAVAGAISGERVGDFMPPADRARLDSALRTAAKQPDGVSTSLRHRVIDCDGRTYWLRRGMNVLNRNAEGKATSLVVTTSEITDLVAMEQRLEHAANHDELTGLANRR
ncbi:GGDEF domain-containing protein, partial [Jatrophihabitans endophyticus]|uniref:GGDEF domain-containing protein n=1 Tax=Jatrophihabitans endophyticus TaxID=1206085 RepID=UPI0019F4A435